MKNKVSALLLALALCLGLTVPAMAAGGFSDVDPNAYYADAVAWAVENGVTSGTSKTTFSPDATCTRGQIITFMWRVAGSPVISADDIENPPVKDVSLEKYYFYPVVWAKNENLFDGDVFRPDAPCTRLAAVEFMSRYCKTPHTGENRVSGAGFSDVDSEAVDWAVARGITGGTGENTFSPDQTCTRGQIVTLLYRDAAFDPTGSYVSENGLYRLELSKGRHVEFYRMISDEDESSGEPRLKGTLKGSPYRWAWVGLSIILYKDYVEVTYDESAVMSGKYIRQ